jgi:rod shape-determining protein MreC
MSGRLVGYGHRAPRVFRRRLITFAVLLAVSLGLMATSGTPPIKSLQNGLHFAFAPALDAVNGVGAQIRSIGEAIAEIDRLRSDNASLNADNKRLEAENQRLAALGPENQQLSALLQIRSSFAFSTTAARIIVRDVVDAHRIVTIDKGTNAGLAEGDVVIAAGGALAGRITAIGASSARVTLISDADSVVIGEVANSRATGEVRGDPLGALVMAKVDATQRLVIGDEVITAGIVLGDGIRSPYPKGLVLGRIRDVTRDPNAFVQTAYLDPAADLDRLEVVLVITNYEGGIPLPSAAPSGAPSGAPSPTPSAGPSATAADRSPGASARASAAAPSASPARGRTSPSATP